MRTLAPSAEAIAGRATRRLCCGLSRQGVVPGGSRGSQRDSYDVSLALDIGRPRLSVTSLNSPLVIAPLTQHWL
jgi:hypothetical protein